MYPTPDESHAVPDAAIAIPTGGDEAATYATTLALAAAYGAVAWGITAIVLQRRDIVDER